MGSNLSRKIPLLGIAHPVERINFFSGAEGALGDGTQLRPQRRRNGQTGLIFIFCKFWKDDPFFFFCVNCN